MPIVEIFGSQQTKDPKYIDNGHRNLLMKIDKKITTILCYSNVRSIYNRTVYTHKSGHKSL